MLAVNAHISGTAAVPAEGLVKYGQFADDVDAPPPPVLHQRNSFAPALPPKASAVLLIVGLASVFVLYLTLIVVKSEMLVFLSSIHFTNVLHIGYCCISINSLSRRCIFVAVIAHSAKPISNDGANDASSKYLDIGIAALCCKQRPCQAKHSKRYDCMENSV